MIGFAENTYIQVYEDPFDQHKNKKAKMRVSLQQREHEIILYNDDVNTFDHVIKTLIAVCEHTTPS